MELRTYKIAPFLDTLSVRHCYFSDERIVDMLNRAEALGFNLSEPGSPLEGLTLAELDILTRDTPCRC